MDDSTSANSDPLQDGLSTQQSSDVLTRPIILGDLTLASPTTQTTVGSAGGASALPVTPTGYLIFNLGNTSYVLPFYALS